MTRKTVLAIAGFVVVLAVVAGAFVWHPGKRAAHDAATQAITSTQPSTPSTSATPRGDVTIDLRRQQLIGVRTVKATKQNLNRPIRTVGVVRSDETRVVDVNAKVEGWVRDLAADYTGRFVGKGDLLLTLYSPDLLATEQEYLLALKSRDELQSSVMPDAKTRADALVAAARQRLARWDLGADELRDLEEHRLAKDTIAFRAPTSGFVIDKPVVKGAHVMPGQTLFKIADLSVVWIEADVYEPDAPFVKLGTTATVMLDAYPGERTSGRVIYISPFVDDQTRTNKVRYEFANPQGRLKPGMYASVEINTAGGVGITVPTDAVLDSGREQIVFVAQGEGHFTPRAVTVGRRIDGSVEILKGLSEGEEVASGAAFFLDSESQLRGAVQGSTPPSSQSGVSSSAGERLQISLRTVPDPPKVGETQFDVMVTNASGMAVVDADVSVQLFMPAMPTMNMPAMKSDVKLSAIGNGRYRGTGQILSTGQWETTVTVTRAGQPLGTSRSTLVVR